jgi:cell division protein FtsZ
MGNRLSVTIISSLAADEAVIEQAHPIPEQFLAPPPAILEQVEEPPTPAPKVEIMPVVDEADPMEVSAADTAATTAKPDDLIQFVPPAPVESQAPPLPPSIKKPTPRLIPPKKKPVVEKEPQPTIPKEKYVHAKQEVMQFEPITRGRFEKSEPTIVEGQDLDVPTFMRKNIRVK